MATVVPISKGKKDEPSPAATNPSSFCIPFPNDCIPSKKNINNFALEKCKKKNIISSKKRAQ